MGPICQPTSSQYRLPQLDTNPKVRKDNVAEKRKRAVPTKRFKPSTSPKPGETAMQPPVTVSKVSEAPENRPPLSEKAQLHKSTPWPGAGKMSGNLFEDRNWLLPPNYLNNDHKNATGPESPIKEEPKTGEQSISPNAEKYGWGPNCPFCKNQEKEDWDGKCQSHLQQKVPLLPEVQRPQARGHQTLNYQKPQSTQKSTQDTQLDKYPSQTKSHKLWKQKWKD